MQFETISCIICIDSHAVWDDITCASNGCYLRSFSCRLQLLEREEPVEIVVDLVNEVFEVAFSIVYTQYLEAQSFPYTVQEAKRSLLQVIEVHTQWLLQPLMIQFLK